MAKHRPFLFLFLAAQSVLYVSFLGCDLFSLPAAATALKYSALLLCLLAAFVRCASPDGLLLCCALTLTAAADLFLLVLDCHYAWGVALFCPVQILYALRLRRSWHIAPPLWPRIALSALCLFAAAAVHSLNLLTGLVCLYFPQLLCNAAESLRIRANSSGRCFSCGLWLFLCCDICVGLHNLFLAAPPALPGLARAVQLAMWAFYLPSQIRSCCPLPGGLIVENK